MPTLFPWKQGHPSHTGFSSKNRGAKPNSSPSNSSTAPLQPDADSISDLTVNGHLTEGQQPDDDMRTSEEGVSSAEPSSTSVQSSATSGLPNEKGNIEPSICGIMWNGTSEQSISSHGVSCTSETRTSELSTSGIVWSPTSDQCTNEIVWDEVESCSYHGEMNITI